nr:hypothetical protein [Candidatus Sigynarchaeum springense]MDO8118311.1 hypothetical protein [Candidatus Sigynarchaeota archaeon]
MASIDPESKGGEARSGGASKTDLDPSKRDDMIAASKVATDDSLAQVGAGSARGMEIPSIPKEVQEILLEEYRNGHRIILSRLYNRIKRVLKVDARKALKIIDMLVRTKQIRENMSIIKPIVLENDRRRRIHEIVVSSPGIFFNLLKSMLGSGSKVLNHHLRILLEFGLIHEAHLEGKRAFFSDSAFLEQKVFFLHLKMGQSRGIIDHLLKGETGRLTIQEIENSLGMKYSNANYHVKQLVMANILIQDGATNPKFYSFSDSFREFLGKYGMLLEG